MTLLGTAQSSLDPFPFGNSSSRPSQPLEGSEIVSEPGKWTQNNSFMVPFCVVVCSSFSSWMELMVLCTSLERILWSLAHSGVFSVSSQFLHHDSLSWPVLVPTWVGSGGCWSDLEEEMFEGYKDCGHLGPWKGRGDWCTLLLGIVKF